MPDAPAPSEPVKPNDARTIEAILHTMGIDDYDPRVTHQLLELLYRYSSSVLTEARTFCDHADKPSIDQDDIKLAVRSRSSFTFTQPPPRDVAMQLAAERNAIPLPPVDPRAGLALPPDVLNLTRHNFRVVRPVPRPRDPSPDAASSKRPPKRPRALHARTPPRPPPPPADPNTVIDVDNPAASAPSSSTHPPAAGRQNTPAAPAAPNPAASTASIVHARADGAANASTPQSMDIGE